jgi:4-hydroxythreonine-4-phosphate dehydrogenase
MSSSQHGGRSLVVTQGDPDGIGPELLVRLAALGALRAGDRVVAGREVLDRVRRAVDEPWAAQGAERLEPLLVGPDGASTRHLGQFAALRLGVDLVESNPGVALVTAPIDKARAQSEGLTTPGHTEYLARRASVSEFAMAMIGPRLRVALATIHVPLSEVPQRLSAAAIRTPIRLLARWLRDEAHIERPRLGVLGLNPHAGEAGTLGDEEQRLIEPAIHAARSELGSFATVVGPLPADTAFPKHAEGELDGLVAMYHDQGLGPFKLLHFHDGVNVTLGLPYVRTSPDHGTARDIAYSGVGSPGSMVAAVRLARGEP